jgi:hypothetical protein
MKKRLRKKLIKYSNITYFSNIDFNSDENKRLRDIICGVCRNYKNCKYKCGKENPLNCDLKYSEIWKTQKKEIRYIWKRYREYEKVIKKYRICDKCGNCFSYGRIFFHNRKWLCKECITK